MKLNKICISNFRNIDYAEFDLKKLNIFAGPNARGKTNTILAIYWAITDYLMDGSSNYASFKPHGKLDAEVSVELQFDTFTFKKTFAEKWVKTRGSTEVTLQGHETNYYLDGVKYGVNEGNKLLAENLGVVALRGNKKVDIIRSVVDPYYLAQQLSWKDLRAFIIDLVGDVDDMLVLNSKREFDPITDDLVKQKFNVEALTKLYRQQIKVNKEELTKQENIIIGYKQVADVDSVTLQQAEMALNALDDEIADLRVQKQTAVNPNIAKLEAELAEIRAQYADSVNEDRKYIDIANASLDEAIEANRKAYEDKKAELIKLEDEQHANASAISDYEFNIKSLERERDSKADEKARLSIEWVQLDELEYRGSLIAQACPHCGGILNEEELSEHKTQWEADKQVRLDAIVAKGKKLANEIDNLNFKVSELKKPDAIDYMDAIVALRDDVAVLANRTNTLKNQLMTTYQSDTTHQLKAKGLELSAKLDSERLVETDGDVDALIIAKTAEKEIHKIVVAEHDAFVSIQSKITDTNKQIMAIQKAMVTFETKAMLLEDFIKTKLTLLKGNVSKVFGELEFVLIETNIKEGSYNEVCYPLILGKQAPFISGSGAEKIMTGVYIIECVKKALGLQNLPIIFDEADKLDTQTLATKLTTESQIISTRVDDVNYEKVTLVVK